MSRSYPAISANFAVPPIAACNCASPEAFSVHVLYAFVDNPLNGLRVARSVEPIRLKSELASVVVLACVPATRHELLLSDVPPPSE